MGNQPLIITSVETAFLNTYLILAKRRRVSQATSNRLFTMYNCTDSITIALCQQERTPFLGLHTHCSLIRSNRDQTAHFISCISRAPPLFHTRPGWLGQKHVSPTAHTPATLLVRPTMRELTFSNEQADLGVNHLLDSVAFSSHKPQYW